MTAQEIFDTVALKLREQGGPSLDRDGGCAYRGQNGRRCAAGWLIDDDEYHPSMEGSEVSCEMLPDRLVEHEGLLLVLQGAHDVHDSDCVGWFSNVAVVLRNVAHDFELSTAVLDS